MRIHRAAPSTTTDARAAGWIASLILHGALAFGTSLFIQQLKLAPQPSLFQWNVSTIASAPPMSSTPTTAAKQSAPPAQVAEPTAKPVPTKTEPIVQRSESPPPTADHVTPPPMAEHNSYPAVEPTSPPSTTETMEHDSSQPNNAPYAPALSPSSPQTDSALSAREEHIAPLKDAQQNQQAAASSDPQVAALSPASQNKSIKADYGWLADLMAKWIGELDKRYPSALRSEGIQGTVTLSALLHNNGTLSDVRVAKSSGNALLDQVAVEDIRNGPPVRLSRPLERPHMPVKFSIVYDLRTTR